MYPGVIPFDVAKSACYTTYTTAVQFDIELVKLNIIVIGLSHAMGSENIINK